MATRPDQDALVNPREDASPKEAKEWKDTDKDGKRGWRDIGKDGDGGNTDEVSYGDGRRNSNGDSHVNMAKDGVLTVGSNGLDFEADDYDSIVAFPV